MNKNDAKTTILNLFKIATFKTFSINSKFLEYLCDLRIVNYVEFDF